MRTTFNRKEHKQKKRGFSLENQVICTKPKEKGKKMLNIKRLYKKTSFLSRPNINQEDLVIKSTPLSIEVINTETSLMQL